jgi:glucose/arabinose dehydrogenase
MIAVVIGIVLSTVLLTLLPSAAANAAVTLPSGFQESVAFGGLNNPTAVQFAPDGRVFVAEKSGLIKVYDGLSDTTPDTFADLRTNVYNFWDRGLLGLALDPNFPTNPSVYVLYTYDAEIGGTAPKWGQPGVDSDPCPTPPGPTDDGCVVSGRLSSLQASGNAMTGSEKVLLEDWCQQYPSHSIGSLAFGRDGALYVSGGDGASFNFVDYGQDGNPLNPCGDPPVPVGGTQKPPSAEGGALRSQDLRTTGDPMGLNGTILRVDPATGAALSSNPLYNNADPNARRTIASGFRNPFRIAARPGTDEIWVGDVGWGEWEEIDRISAPTGSAAANFGWPCYEGSTRLGGYDAADLKICEDLYSSSGAVTAPYYTYHHREGVVSGETCPTGGSSISGLAFYNGGPYPDAYDGALFFADYSRNCIWAMPKGANGLPDPTKLETFVTGAAAPVNLQIGPNGDLFYADFSGGTIRRISYGAPGGGGTTCATGEYLAQYYAGTQSPTTGTPTLERCETSINNDWGGGGPSTEVGTDNFSTRWTGTHNFEAGNYTFSATADDGIRVWVDNQLIIDGWRDQPPTDYTGPVTLTAGDHEVKVEYYEKGGGAVAKASWQRSSTSTGPTATISSPASTLTWKVNDSINFSGSATDSRGAALPASALSWSAIMHHCSPSDPSSCHEHPLQSFEGVASGSLSAPDHEYPSYLELRLTATDPTSGTKDTKSVRLEPRTTKLNFATNPTGLNLVVGSSSQKAPFSRTVIVGSRNSVSAPAPQTLGRKTYNFQSWSDKGAQTHDITAPDTATTTYTARYTQR